MDYITILHIFEMKPTGTNETVAQLRMKRCRDENLEELDDKAMKHIANLQKRKSIVLMVSLSSPLFLEGANFLGTGTGAGAVQTSKRVYKVVIGL